MADNSSAQPEATWPLVKFAFQIKWDNTELIFQEVTGLSSETQAINYRGAENRILSTVKMPGLQKYGNVTLKKGLFKGDKALWDEYSSIKMNTFKRSTITISLLDEAQNAAMTWTLLNAFPVKITIAEMKSDSTEVAVETMEIAHEGLSVLS